MSEVSILGIGVATLDIYVDRKRMYPGGNEYNVACNAKQLGARAGFLGVFAENLAGRILEETLQNCGVDTSHCHHEKGSSGYSLVKMTEDGDRIFLEWNQNGVTEMFPIGFDEEELAYCKTFDVATLGRCASVSDEKIRYLADSGIDLCYDFHAIYGEEEINRYAPCSRYAFFSCSHLSEEEIHATLKRATDLGCEIAVGTRGVDPVIAYDGKQYYIQETKRVKATDALGAGDSYIAGVLTYYIGARKEGVSQPEALQNALAKAAAHSATVVVIEGSIGVGYDLETEDIHGIVG